MIFQSVTLSRPGAHFKWGPWAGFFTRCWDLKLRFEFSVIFGVDIRKTSQIWTLLLKFCSGSISNNSKITPESFPTNFHIIFTLRSPQTIDFQLKLHRKFKSRPEQPWVTINPVLYWIIDVDATRSLATPSDFRCDRQCWRACVYITAFTLVPCDILPVLNINTNRPPQIEVRDVLLKYEFCLIVHQFWLCLIENIISKMEIEPE